MVELPQTSVLQLRMLWENFWSLFLLLSFHHFLPACSFYNKIQPLVSILQQTMVYQAAMQEEKLRKGPWHKEEDELLVTFVTPSGERRWDYIAKASGLKRSGKSCRWRWRNYLRPNIKHGYISTEEEQIIIQLHKKRGNKWSRIARSLPGITDNKIKKNFQFGRNNAKRDSLFWNLDFSVQKHETDDEHKPGKNTFGTHNSFDVLGFPNSAFASSPYEIRIRDWMSELSDDQSKITQRGGSNIVESCFGCRASLSEHTDTLVGQAQFVI